MTGAAEVGLPRPVRLAAALVAAEAFVLLVVALVLLAKTLLGHPHNAGLAVSDAAIAVVGAAVLGLGARGLARRRPAARTPVIVLELLALPVGVSLAFQAGLVVYGGPILLVAGAVIYLLFTPPARAALDRGDL